MDFDASVHIEADRELVYAVLADVQQCATGPGSPVLMMEKMPPGPTRVGTRWREVVHVGPLLHMTMRSQVTECAVGRHLQMDFRGGGMRGWLRYTLADDGPGATMLRHEEHLELLGPLRVFDAFVARLLAPRLIARLDHLRALIEADVRPS
jgi:hypothetical protein